MKFKLWNKEDLEGIWEISIKIDGVRCHNINGEYVSRKNKPLYNIPKKLNFEIAEIFCGDFKSTIENTRTFKKEMIVLTEHVYQLSPKIDERLLLGEYKNPTKEQITEIFNNISKKYEGLILKQGDILLKVKSEETVDVKIIDIFEGKGRNIGKLGGFITEFGKVGTGLTDKDRKEFYTKSIIGETIEVKCMEFTSDGKFRHPRFVRIRYDK